MDTYITFIIPSIGRVSLNDSIDSLLNQTCSDWNAIIIFDGVKSNLLINDDRIKVLEIDKIGNLEKRFSSGLVRNEGMKIVSSSKWIGFLDDDDTLSHNYISNLKIEDDLNKPEVVIFRMMYENGYILPTRFDTNITRNKVGISFSIRSYIADNILFDNNPYEDFFYLKKLQEMKYKIIISSYVCYFVNCFYKATPIFPKILINYK